MIREHLVCRALDCSWLPRSRLARLSPCASVCGAADEGGPWWLPQVIDDLRAAAAANPGMRLQLVGHSMGAGCAAILAMMCAQPQTRISSVLAHNFSTKFRFPRFDVVWKTLKIQWHAQYHFVNVTLHRAKIKLSTSRTDTRFLKFVHSLFHSSDRGGRKAA